MEIIEIRHAWPEHSGFILNRPNGRRDYTFLHFFNSVEIRIGNTTFITEPNTCVFYAPDTPQWFHSSEPLIHDWIHIDPSLSYILQKLGITENRLYHSEHCEFITEIFQGIENDWFASRKFRNEYIQCKLNEFLITFSRHCTGEATFRINQSSFETYTKIRQNIMLNLDRHWTVQDMASAASISPSQFHAVYKQFFGIAPMSDLIYARINAAKNRLAAEPIPVYRLAEELGYSNQYHFIRQFGQIVGCSPTAYRKQLENT